MTRAFTMNISVHNGQSTNHTTMEFAQVWQERSILHPCQYSHERIKATKLEFDNFKEFLSQDLELWYLPDKTVFLWKFPLCKLESF